MKLTNTEKLLYVIAAMADYNRKAFSMRGALAMTGDPEYQKFRRLMLKDFEDKRKKKKLYSAFQSLKRNKFIQEQIFNNSQGYILTEKGKMKLYKIDAVKLEGKKLPKGQYLLVFFDIPEKMRNIRRLLRFLLREMGFEKMQKSVWMSSYDCSNKLNKIIQDLKLQDYVNILKVVSN